MPWVKGQSGNPAGRAVGSRHKLGEDFLRDAHEAWRVHGKAALNFMATSEPGKFAMMIAGLMPREELAVAPPELTAAEIVAQLEVIAAEANELAAADPAPQREGVTH